MAERVAEIQNKLKRQRGNDVDVDMDLEVDDAIDNINAEQEIEDDIAMDMNQTDDYDDGDPWGEEAENNEDYY